MRERSGVGKLRYRGGIGDGSGVDNGGRVGHLGDGSICDFSGNGNNGLAFVTNDGVESAFLVSAVVYDAMESIRLHERVGSADGVSSASLLLLLYVTALVVMYGVLELVIGGRFRLSVLQHGQSRGNSCHGEDDHNL